MTRHDLLVRLDEIRAVVVTCRSCGTEIHVPISEHGRMLTMEKSSASALIMTCQFCTAEFHKADQEIVKDLIRFLMKAHDRSGDVCRIALKGNGNGPEESA